MNKKQIKKMRFLINQKFKSMLSESMRLNFRSRLKIARIILFKNKKFINKRGV